MWIGRANVQVVSDCGDMYRCPCGNGQLFVDLSRSAHDGFGERQDVVFRGHTYDFDSSRVDS